MPASCHYFVQVSFALDSHRSFALPEQPSLMPVFYVLTSWGDLQIWVLVSIPGGPIIHPVSTNIPSFVKELLCFETKRCLIQAFTLRHGYVCRELFEKGENFNMVVCLASHSFNVPLLFTITGSSQSSQSSIQTIVHSSSMLCSKICSRWGRS